MKSSKTLMDRGLCIIMQEKIHPNSITAHKCNDIEGVYQSVRSSLSIGMLLDISIEQDNYIIKLDDKARINYMKKCTE